MYARARQNIRRNVGKIQFFGVKVSVSCLFLSIILELLSGEDKGINYYLDLAKRKFS